MKRPEDKWLILGLAFAISGGVSCAFLELDAGFLALAFFALAGATYCAGRAMGHIQNSKWNGGGGE